MKKSIVIIGMGEMSGVFSRGLLRSGYPLVPITRNISISTIAEQIADPELILVAVGEADLDTVLQHLPTQWKNKVALLQNELLPNDWKKHQLIDPTIISVWFEKKQGQDFKILIPSPIWGPQAGLLKEALAQLAIPSWIIHDEQEMLFELVRKNIYILCTNIAGLEVGGDVNTLWHQHRELAVKVIDDILLIQNHLTAQQHDKERLIEAIVLAINGDLKHQCKGRSAPARLKRAIDYADKYQLIVNELQRIFKRYNNTRS